MRFERLIVFVAALSAALATARLGVWQLDRARQKTALQSAIDGRYVLPPLSGESLAASAPDAEAQWHRLVELRGRWVPGGTVYLDNRQMKGLPGFFVVTPLQLPDGTAVAVQRGWLPRDPRDRTRVQAPALPAGEVRLRGRIAPPPSRLLELAEAPVGLIRQNLDLDAYARELRLRFRPLSVLQVDEESAAADGLLRAWPRPAADVSKHHGYAFQWFALCALIVGLYVWFQFIRPRRRA